MMVGRDIFNRYLQNESGAFAVLFVLMFGFVFMALNIGITALKVQNPATSAEQLIDLACQKITTADPALYPTADAVIAAGMSALDARLYRGLSNNEGAFNIVPSDPDPRFNSPVNKDGTFADLRRFEFTVSYTGKAFGLNTKIAPSGSADINVSKKCRPVCTPMTNVIYSNAAAVGHWVNGTTWKVAQNIDANNSVEENFQNVPFSDGFQNPGKANDRYVLTILDPDGGLIRYRKIVQLPDEFYIDNDRVRTPGEPQNRKLQRIVVDEEDQIFIQSLNADGSLPGMCGDVEEKPCVGNNCCVGNACGPCHGLGCDQPKFICSFKDEMPVKASFRDLKKIRQEGKTVRFIDNGPTRAGRLLITLASGRQFTTRLAPFYKPNDITVTVNFKDGKLTIPSQTASALALTEFATKRWNILSMPGHKFLVHMAGVHWFWFWDGNELCKRFRSPIVFDTHGLGAIQTTKQPGQTGAHGQFFDYFGNGERVQVEWPIGAGQAWLVDNRDGRAAVDMNGRRFFGDLDGHDDGYEKLRELDTSGTGILTGQDLAGLALWFDNGNGLVEPGELQSLAEAGVTSVDARAEWQELPDGGQVLRSTAVIHGRTIMTEDIFVEIFSKAMPIENANSGSVE